MAPASKGALLNIPYYYYYYCCCCTLLGIGNNLVVLLGLRVLVSLSKVVFHRIRNENNNNRNLDAI